MSTKKLFKVADVAEEFGVTPVCVRSWIQKGKLNAFVTPGGHCRITADTYTTFVRKYKDADYALDIEPETALAMGE